jgi:hypothetical protein
MDTTQPSTPQEFIAAGATPEQAALLHQQHEALAGRRGAEAQAAIAVAARDQPSPPTPSAPQSSVTQGQAQEALGAHTEAQLAAHLDHAFSPPASPSDYAFPTHEDLTDEQFAADNAVKTALHAEAMPKWAVDSIAKSLGETARAVASETPAEAQARLGSYKARLTALWGGEANYVTNIGTVDNLLSQMSARSPALRTFIERAAPLLDPLSVDLLLQIALRRAGRH